MPKPQLHTVPDWYHKYILAVPEEDLITAFERHQKDLVTALQNLPSEKWSHRYAACKWSIKEVVQHIIDAERIFCYRALCFARHEKASLPGFDENDYVAASGADARTEASLLKELKSIQQSAALLFASFTEQQLSQTGVANGNTISVLAIGFITVGHALHHLNIINERYLLK